MSDYKSIFLSDIHLGSKGCQSDFLNNFLNNHSCDNLFLVGDIIDCWRLKSKLYWPQSHSDVFNNFLNKFKTKLIPLGGIQINNLNKLKIVRSDAFAILSEIKKKPANIINRLF